MNNATSNFSAVTVSSSSAASHILPSCSSSHQDALINTSPTSSLYSPASVGLNYSSVTSSTAPLKLSTNQTPRATSATLKQKLPDYNTSFTSSLLELKTVNDYALHHLFNLFLTQADQKLNQCVNEPTDPEPRVELICGPRADPKFDKLLSSLGRIASSKPKPLIDSFFFWRKNKSLAACKVCNQLNNLRSGLPVNGTSYHRNADPNRLGDTPPPTPSPQSHIQITELHRKAFITERHSIVSIYILCRVLMEIFGQTNVENLSTETLDRVEDVIYVQLKQTDPEVLEQSHLRLANWDAFGQVLGVISELRFSHIALRFLTDLQSLHPVLSVKGMAGRYTEARALLIIRGLRYIRINVSEEVEWKLACDILAQLSKLAVEAHGRIIKYAYCHLFKDILLPIVSSVQQVQLGTNQLGSVFEILRPWVSNMLTKPKHWQVCFPLLATLLCVAPRDYFVGHWFQFVMSLQSRLRERSTRATALRGVCRILWVYVFRIEDKDSDSKVSEVLRLLCQPGKKALFSGDPCVAEPLVQIIRIIGFKYPDICFRKVIYHLMGYELFTGTTPPSRAEHLESERLTIGIRSFLAIMKDFEDGKWKPCQFPVTFEGNYTNLEVFSLSLAPNSSSPRQTALPGFKCPHIAENLMPRSVNVEGFSESSKESHEQFCKILNQITIICDNELVNQSGSHEKFAGGIGSVKTPMSDTFGFSRREETIGDLKRSFFDLVSVVIQALPRCLSPQLGLRPFINLLCSCLTYVHYGLSGIAVNSMKYIAQQNRGEEVVMGLAQYIFAFDERNLNVTDGGLLALEHIENTARLYVELLDIWMKEVYHRLEKSNDYSIAELNKGIGYIDSPADWAKIDEIESHAVFFLCSPSHRVRELAVKMLRMIPKLDRVFSNKTIEKRVIQLLDCDIQYVFDANEGNLSTGERMRLERGIRYNGTPGALVDLCISNVPFESALWCKGFPGLIKLIWKNSSFVASQTRKLVCNRLSQMQYTIKNLSGTSRTTTSWRVGGPGIISGSCESGAGSSSNSTVNLTNLVSGNSSTNINLALPAKPHFQKATGITGDMVIEQWKNYLIFACITLTNYDTVASFEGCDSSSGGVGAGCTASGVSVGCTSSGGNSTTGVSSNGHHLRGESKSSQSGRIGSVTDLFGKVTQLLSSPNPGVREAVVTGLGSIGVNLYRALLECLKPAVKLCHEDAKNRVGGSSTSSNSLSSHQRVVGTASQKYRRTDFLRTEITHIYKLTSRFLRIPEINRDEWILDNITHFTKSLLIFLSDFEVQTEWGYQKLRIFYCGLVCELFEALNRTVEPMRYLPFESRKAAFALMEDWCGFSPNQYEIATRESSMRRAIMEREAIDSGDVGIIMTSMDQDKRNLQMAALSAMASLCAGPVVIVTNSKTNLKFDFNRMLTWIDSIFDTTDNQIMAIGRRALRNLILYNPQHEFIMSRAVGMCFSREKSSKTLLSYLEVIFEILENRESLGLPYWKIVCAALFVLGNEDDELRFQALKLLRLVETFMPDSLTFKDYDIMVKDKNSRYFHRAQREISTFLARCRSEHAYHVISQLTKYFKDSTIVGQMSLIGLLLPWIKEIELKYDRSNPPNKLSKPSFMILSNLMEMMILRETCLLNEKFEELWQALINSNYGSQNGQIIMDFIVNLCLERREERIFIQLLQQSRQIVSYITRYESDEGRKIVEFLLQNLSPRFMTPSTEIHDYSRSYVADETSVNPVSDEDRASGTGPNPGHSLPYIADIDSFLPSEPTGGRMSGTSVGQICLVLLVDLSMISVPLTRENVCRLLQCVLLIWDHTTSVFRDAARQCMVNLLGRLIISDTLPDHLGRSPLNADILTMLDDSTTASIQQLIHQIRTRDPCILWTYEDFNGYDELVSSSSLHVPASIIRLATETAKAFSLFLPNFPEEWSKFALEWATSCSVRHLACRSFQLFRTVFNRLEPLMLADILARLSNTVSDEDVLVFSTEILLTVKCIVESLQPDQLLLHPQLFWAVSACMTTVHESEYILCLDIMECLILKLNFSQSATLTLLSDYFPAKWDGLFQGLQSLIYLGLTSRRTYNKTMSILGQLISLPFHSVLGDDTRYLPALLSFIPTLLQTFTTHCQTTSVSCSSLPPSSPQLTPTLEPPQNIDSIKKTVHRLRNVANTQNLSEISHVLASYAKFKYRKSSDFAKAIYAAIKNVYFPSRASECFLFYISMLSNTITWLRYRVLEMLNLFISEPLITDSSSHSCHNHFLNPSSSIFLDNVTSLDSMKPLIQLLDTQFCSQAVSILEHLMSPPAEPTSTSTTTTSLDKVSSSAKRANFSRYSPQDFSSPDPKESGWQVDFPHLRRIRTQKNVHAVFYTCLPSDKITRQPCINQLHDASIPPPHVTDSSPPTALIHSSRSTLDDCAYEKVDVADLVVKLQSLDSFFDDQQIVRAAFTSQFSASPSLSCDNSATMPP